MRSPVRLGAVWQAQSAKAAFPLTGDGGTRRSSSEARPVQRTAILVTSDVQSGLREYLIEHRQSKLKLKTRASLMQEEGCMRTVSRQLLMQTNYLAGRGGRRERTRDGLFGRVLSTSKGVLVYENAAIVLNVHGCGFKTPSLYKEKAFKTSEAIEEA